MRAAAKVRRAAAGRRSASAFARWLTREREGSIAVEFSVLLPVLAVMLLGAVQASSLVWARASVIEAAAAASDLTSQFVGIEETSMLAVFQASERMIDPAGGPIDGYEATVSSVLVCECDENPSEFCYTVIWSHSYQGGALTTGRTQGDTVDTIPPSLGASANSTMILAETSLVYEPAFEFIFDKGTFLLTGQQEFRPRQSREVAHTGAFQQSQASLCP